MSRLNLTFRSAIMIASLAVFSAQIAGAQGKGKGKEKQEKREDKREDKRDDQKVKRVVVTSPGEVVVVPAKKIPPGQLKKHVTTSDALVVTRDVLVTNGFQVVRVAPQGTARIVYFRRGNNGNGRGLGPVQQLVIVPAGDVVRFRSVPDALLSTILTRLGLY